MKRVFLLIITNIAIMLMLSIFASILGIGGFIEKGSINYSALLAFAALFGFGGSFISLLISKWSAKMMTGAQVIVNPSTSEEQFLVQTVSRLSQNAGISMPEVAIYDSSDPNAFATGPSKNNALVAVSSGLLNVMSKDEVEAVLAHEIGHVANGDMVTLTLVQGVMNTFVIFASRAIGYFVDKVILKNDSDSPGLGYYVTHIVLDIVLGLLAGIVVAYFSRIREFRADAASANLCGANKMISALQKLDAISTGQLPSQMSAFGISGAKQGGFLSLFMSHPPIADRIAALQRNSGRI